MKNNNNKKKTKYQFKNKIKMKMNKLTNKRILIKMKGFNISRMER